jgi:AcrR family transcriptional regulator
MREIQGTALALFESRGYDATTVDDVAAAADVSPRTLFRHFPTKEDLVFWSTYSPRLPALMGAQSADVPAVEALQRSVASGLAATFGEDRDLILRWARIGFRTPTLRPRMHAQQGATAELFSALLLERAPSGTPALRVRVVGSGLAAALYVALDHWQFTDGRSDLQQLILSCLRDATAEFDL